MRKSAAAEIELKEMSGIVYSPCWFGRRILTSLLGTPPECFRGAVDEGSRTNEEPTTVSSVSGGLNRDRYACFSMISSITDAVVRHRISAEDRATVENVALNSVGNL